MTTQGGGNSMEESAQSFRETLGTWPHFLASRTELFGATPLGFLITAALGKSYLLSSLMVLTSWAAPGTARQWRHLTDRSNRNWPLPSLPAQSYPRHYHTTEICWQTFPEGSVHCLWLAQSTPYVVTHTHNPSTRGGGRRIRSSSTAAATQRIKIQPGLHETCLIK